MNQMFETSFAYCISAAGGYCWQSGETCQGTGESMGRYVESLSDGLGLHSQKKDRILWTDSLKKGCPGYSREAHLIAQCWVLACTFPTLLSTIQHPQEERISWSEDIPVDTTAKPATHSSGISVERQESLVFGGDSCQLWGTGIPSMKILQIAKARGPPWREVSSIWGN